MNRYSSYSRSPVPWLDGVPSHWAAIRLDRLFRYRSEEPLESDGRVTGYLDGRVTLRSNVAGQKIKGVVYETGWQRVHVGDFAISGMNAHLGGMGVSDSEGKCSPIYMILEPLPGTNAHFVSLAVRHAAHLGAIKALVQTIRFNSADMKRADLKSIYVPLPTEEEQEQIVRFVRHLDSKVNRLIKAKRRLIELLNEQKQAIIHQAVTRGLDPTVPLKPSGIGWLGDIPAHWEVKRMKEVSLLNPSRSEVKGLPQEALVTVLPMESVSEWGVVDTVMEEKYGVVQSGLTYMRNGDVSIAKITPCFENGKGAALVGLPYGFAFGSTEFHVLRPTHRISSDFLYFVTRMPKFRELGELNMKGSAGQKRVPSDFVKNFEFGLPPIEDQEEIVVHLRQALVGFDKTDAKIRAEIDLIREYRTRLVADVVTGQLDVRHLDLPDVEEQLEALSEDSELDSELDETDNLLEEAGV